MKKLYFTRLCLALSIFWACDKTAYLPSYTPISSSNDDIKSHNHGQNCSNCHTRANSTTPDFTISGSVFHPNLVEPASNGFIEIYNRPNGNGDLLKRIEIDAFGNFYTNDSIHLNSSKFVVYTAENGNKKYMNSALVGGSCNSCHDGSNNNLLSYK